MYIVCDLEYYYFFFDDDDILPMYIIKKNNTCMYDDDNDITNMVLVWCGVVFMLLYCTRYSIVFGSGEAIRRTQQCKCNTVLL